MATFAVIATVFIDGEFTQVLAECGGLCLRDIRILGAKSGPIEFAALETQQKHAVLSALHREAARILEVL